MNKIRVIKPSVEILKQDDFSIDGIKKFIDKCTSILYDGTSYDAIKDTLNENEYNRLLEFGTIHLFMTIPEFDEMRDNLCAKEIWYDELISFNHHKNNMYITTSYRYYLEIINGFPRAKSYLTSQNNDYYKNRPTLHFIVSFGSADEIKDNMKLTHISNIPNVTIGDKHNSITFVKPNYVNLYYDEVETDDVGNNEIYDIDGFEQNFYDDDDTPTVKYLYMMQETVLCYFNLIKNGISPIEAKEVLPLSAKTDLISRGFYDDWKQYLTIAKKNSNITENTRRVLEDVEEKL